MRRIAIRGAILLALAAVVIVPASALGGAHAARSHTVTLKNIRFHPGSMSINRGDSVTWLWQDGGIKHNVTGQGFHSRTQGSGSFTVRFTHSGTFKYECTIHVAEGMRGTIVVH